MIKSFCIGPGSICSYAKKYGHLQQVDGYPKALVLNKFGWGPSQHGKAKGTHPLEK